MLDLIGVFAFSAYGASKALQHHYNISGILLCAFVTSLGGGTIREVILGHMPFYFFNPLYVGVVIAATIFAISTQQHFKRIDRYLHIMDAIGLAAFAYIGAHAAWAAQAGPVAIVCCAVLTAAGGGILSDVLTGAKPTALYKDFYIPPAALLAVSFAVFGELALNPVVAYVLIASTVGLRLSGAYLVRHQRMLHARLRLVRWRRARSTSFAE